MAIAERDSARFITLGGGTVAVAGLAVLVTLNATSFTLYDWIVSAVGAVIMCFAALYALPIRGLRLRRTGQSAEAVFLDVAVAAPLVAIGGAVGITAAGLAYALGFGAAAIIARGNAPTNIARHGVLRVLCTLIFIAFVKEIALARALPPLESNAIFALALALVVALFLLGVSAPVAALSHRITIARIWERELSDPRTWIVGCGNVVWALVVGDAIARDHYYMAMVMWLPVIVTSFLLRIIDDQHAELHRLRLVRDAVQAMLGERDPLPQINAILATLRVPAQDETVTVFAAAGERTDTWRTVTTLGPTLSSAGDETRRRILARLKFSGQAATTIEDEYYIAYAFGSRLDGDIHGALVVHRRHERALSNEQMSQFINAAAELAPLLRDMRAIAATQSAATIDGLTALYNRASTMERLQIMLDDSSIAERGAVLMLDIDHFKTINDQLGHAAGDECLKRIAQIIRTTVRGGDTAGRIGGEEFLVVMPGATSDVALTVAERLRLAVALGGMRYANGEPVTTSIGIATATAGDTAELIMARADRGLYEAKRQGRNRVVEERETA
ncbi:MAG: GGDEF domain-containing protein [bacterium]|nr:GGDEF domain-containing protein [bacterium]